MNLSRLSLETPNQAQKVVEGLYEDLERRIAASPPGLCPVDISLGFLKLCHAQTCGKCVPCRIGLGQLANLMDDVLSERATLDTISRIEKTARTIADSADCAIGYEAAAMVLRGVKGFRDDYIEHVKNNRCTSGLTQPVPCVALCPAHVDIPGYIALIRAGRYADAVKLIRKDNPFPTACAYVCEHPCEARCRRNMIDDAVNICGLKHFAFNNALHVPAIEPNPSTGKRVAIIGGGPGGLSAAFYLQLMGHQTVVYEQRPKLGGMLRYGIPRYRLPEDMLDNDIGVILDTGVEVHTGVSVGKDIPFKEIEENYDAVFLCIGAHIDKKIGIPGETSTGVISAVEMLRDMGEGNPPDFTGKRVCVIGGGNVSMDATRTALRLGAESVTTVYRRRVQDMTALKEEIEEAAAEGATILPLESPLRIEADENGHVSALVTLPQQIGPVEADPRGQQGGTGHPVRHRHRRHRPGHRRQGLHRRRRLHRPRTHQRTRGQLCRGQSEGIRGRRRRHRSVHRHPRHCRRQGRRGKHRQLPRLQPRDPRRRRGHPGGAAVSGTRLRQSQPENPSGLRMRLQLRRHQGRHDRGGSNAGGIPLPALRPLRLRQLPGR